MLLLADCLPRSTGLVTINDVLHHQVQYVIRATGRYVDEITSRYFQGIDRWIPVISRRRFNDRIVDGRGLYTADFSILLLTMSLITYCPTNIPGNIPDQETVYLCTKMLFAQVQASAAASTYLIQACILLAVFEYASGRAEVAFVSIETCAVMSHVLSSYKRSRFQDFEDPDEGLQAIEEKNLLWGVMICERCRTPLNLEALNQCANSRSSLFNFEVNAPIQPLAAVHPDIYDFSPYEVETLDGNIDGYIMPRLGVSVATMDSSKVGSFGRHAQVVYLMDQLRNATRLLCQETRLTELFKVDDQLQELLSGVMEQGHNHSWGHYCGAISTSIRFAINLLINLFPFTLSFSHFSYEGDTFSALSLVQTFDFSKTIVISAKLTWPGRCFPCIDTSQTKLTLQTVAEPHLAPLTH